MLRGVYNYLHRSKYDECVKNRILLITEILVEILKHTDLEWKESFIPKKSNKNYDEHSNDEVIENCWDEIRNQRRNTNEVLYFFLQCQRLGIFGTKFVTNKELDSKFDRVVKITGRYVRK